MKTFRVRVRIAGGRIVDIEIQAPDVHAALNMAKSQYGDGNVLGAAITASSLTLAIAGIECHDLVLGTSASLINTKNVNNISNANDTTATNIYQQLILDPNAED